MLGAMGSARVRRSLWNPNIDESAILRTRELIKEARKHVNRAEIAQQACVRTMLREVGASIADVHALAEVQRPAREQARRVLIPVPLSATRGTEGSMVSESAREVVIVQGAQCATPAKPSSLRVVCHPRSASAYVVAGRLTSRQAICGGCCPPIRCDTSHGPTATSRRRCPSAPSICPRPPLVSAR